MGDWRTWFGFASTLLTLAALLATLDYPRFDLSFRAERFRNVAFVACITLGLASLIGSIPAYFLER